MRPSAAHFDLLTRFGRSPERKKLTTPQKEELWKASCEAARLPYITSDVVIEEWKKFVVGESEHSRLAMSAAVDPSYITVGVALDGKLKAGHTMKVRALLRQVLAFYRKMFPDEASMRADLEALFVEMKTKKK